MLCIYSMTTDRSSVHERTMVSSATFVCDNYQAVDEGRLLSAAEHAISSARIAKSRRFHHAIDRRACLASHLLLAYACHQQMTKLPSNGASYPRNVGIDELIDFAYGSARLRDISKDAYGKPSFTDGKGPFFNYSHCTGGIAVALSSEAVGVDYQDIDELGDLSLCDFVMTPSERNAIVASSDPAKRFIRLWSIKEAYVKCLGCGLTLDFGRLDFASYAGGEFIAYDHTFNVYERTRSFVTVCHDDLRGHTAHTSSRLRPTRSTAI